MGNEADPFAEMRLQDSGFGGVGDTASAGSSWSLNWSGTGELLSGIGMSLQGGAQIGSALGAREFASIQASAYEFAGRQSAADLKRRGDAAVRNIGIVQQKGLDAATLRYNALGHEIAAQRVAAAGSGIDLSSRTVGKAEETSRRNAAWDVSRISRNTQIAAQNYNEQAEMAYRNSAFAQINGEYQAEVANIQGRLQKNIGLFSGISQAVLGDLQTGIGVTKMFMGGGAGGGFG